jgi:GMP synthase-like glutamine amidotransferase
MKIAVLQHAAFEGPGEINVWAAQRNHAVDIRHLYRGDSFPALDAFDFLVVMGGEMNIYQYRDWPWLKSESAFIRAALDSGKRAIGICLGAQLIADALGGGVVQNSEVELGWLPVVWTGMARGVFHELPPTSTVLHWHGDTFALPEGAIRLAESEACAEQGFLVPNKCLGLQFHMEVDPKLVSEFVKGQGEWPRGPFTQTPERILGEADSHCEQNRRLLHGILDAFVEP